MNSLVLCCTLDDTVVIQDDLVKVPPARLPSDVFLNHVCSKLVQVDGVSERFAEKIYTIIIMPVAFDAD